MKFLHKFSNWTYPGFAEMLCEGGVVESAISLKVH